MKKLFFTVFFISMFFTSTAFADTNEIVGAKYGLERDAVFVEYENYSNAPNLQNLPPYANFNVNASLPTDKLQRTEGTPNYNFSKYLYSKYDTNFKLYKDSDKGINKIYTAPVLKIVLKEDVKQNDSINLNFENANPFFVEATYNGISVYEAFGLETSFDRDKGRLEGREYVRQSNEKIYKFETDGSKLTFLNDFPKGTKIEIPLVTSALYTDLEDYYKNYFNKDDVVTLNSAYVSVKSNLSAIDSGKYLFASKSSKSSSDAEESKNQSKQQYDSESKKKTEYENYKNKRLAEMEKIIKNNKHVSFNLGDSETIYSIDKDAIDLLVKANNDFQLNFKNGNVTMPVSAIKGASKAEFSIQPINVAREVYGMFTKYDQANSNLSSQVYIIDAKINEKETKNFIIVLNLSSITGVTSVDKANLSFFNFTDGSYKNFILLDTKLVNNSESIEAQANASKSDIFGIMAGKNKFLKPEEQNKNVKVLKLQMDNKTYTVNDVKKEAVIAPELINGVVYVPLRFISLELNAKVDWDDKTKTATITKDNKKLDIKSDEIIEGLGVKPVLKNGNFLVPIKYISEKLGAKAIYDKNDKTITIS